MLLNDSKMFFMYSLKYLRANQSVGFVVLTSGHFMLSLALLFVFVCFFFSVPFSIVITSLQEERAGLCASCAFVCSLFILHPLISVLFLFFLVSQVGCSL